MQSQECEYSLPNEGSHHEATMQDNVDFWKAAMEVPTSTYQIKDGMYDEGDA